MPTCQGTRKYTSYSLNSFTGDCIGTATKVIEGDTRSLDYDSYIQARP